MTFLNLHSGGDYILTSALYDEANAAQKAEVLKSFGDRQSVTREEVYEFVRRQIDLRAIEELDPDITAEDIAALDTVEAQNEFIAQNAATLRGVSQAITDGRFNPYEKDMHAVFRADPRPTLADPDTQNAINFHRNNGTIPPAVYGVKHSLAIAIYASLQGAMISQHWTAMNKHKFLTVYSVNQLKTISATPHLNALHLTSTKISSQITPMTVTKHGTPHTVK